MLSEYDRFDELYAGWLEARGKSHCLFASGYDSDEARALKVDATADEFARRLAAIPSPTIPRLLAKLELLAHYVGGEDPAERGNPQLVLLAGIRADVLALRTKQLEDDDAESSALFSDRHYEAACGPQSGGRAP